MSQIIGFLELPVCLPGLEENGVNNPDRTVPGKFQPNHIVAYHESYFVERTMIYLMNGQPFLIELTVDQYEKIIADYWTKMANQNKTGIIKPLK